MNEAVRKVDPGALVTGLILIAVGITFLVGDFGDMVRMWWPMIIVLVGVPRLFSARTVWSGFWLIAIGAWLQLVRLHLFGLTFLSSGPLVLIVIGAGIALRALFDVGREERREP
jgi:hypothetical protein